MIRSSADPITALLALCLGGAALGATSLCRAQTQPADLGIASGDRQKAMVGDERVTVLLEVERLAFSCDQRRADVELLRTCELEAGLRLAANQRVSGRLYSECEGRIEVRHGGSEPPTWQTLRQVGNASTSLSNGRGSALIELNFRAPTDQLWSQARATDLACRFVRVTLY